MFTRHYVIKALHLLDTLKYKQMQSNFLFPNHFKKIGWFLFVPGIVLGALVMIGNWEPDFFKMKVFAFSNFQIMAENSSFTFIENNVIDEIAGLLIIFGAMFIAFSKEKKEDEFISKIRLESLAWATYLNYGILIFAFVFVYGMSFFWVLVLNMFTILIFFILRFNWALAKSKKQLQDEK